MPNLPALRVTPSSPAEGTKAAPICIDDDGDADVAISHLRTRPVLIRSDSQAPHGLIRAFTPLSIVDDDADTADPANFRATPTVVELEDSEHGDSPREGSTIETDASHENEQGLTTEPPSPTAARKYRRKRCLVKSARYRAFRTGLYALFAVKAPGARELPFQKVLRAINGELPAEKRFGSLEAKQILKYMKDKLIDSLCADRVAGVDFTGIQLYA